MRTALAFRCDAPTGLMQPGANETPATLRPYCATVVKNSLQISDKNYTDESIQVFKREQIHTNSSKIEMA